MKISKVLKVLGAVAAVAALTPYKVERDEETGTTNVKALLWGFTYTPDGRKNGRNVDDAEGPNVPGKGESELFADDEPDAAVLEADVLQIIADEAQEAADEAQAIADEAQAVADEAGPVLSTKI